MPIHFNDLDVAAKIEGPSSVLIIPCYMCPAVTVAVREDKPFIQLFSSFLTSPPFEKYLKKLQSRLGEKGVTSKVFKSNYVHQWFLCMWTSGCRKKLKRQLEKYDSVIVLGCESANETVRDLSKGDTCKIIQGMEVTGFMNAKMKFQWPGNISFEDCKIIPFSQQEKEEGTSG